MEALRPIANVVKLSGCDVPEWMLGPLGPLLRDPSIAEIMVNRHDQIFVERSGQLLYTGMKFESENCLGRLGEAGDDGMSPLAT